MGTVLKLGAVIVTDSAPQALVEPALLASPPYTAVQYQVPAVVTWNAVVDTVFELSDPAGRSTSSV